MRSTPVSKWLSKLGRKNGRGTVERILGRGKSSRTSARSVVQDRPGSVRRLGVRFPRQPRGTKKPRGSLKTFSLSVPRSHTIERNSRVLPISPTNYNPHWSTGPTSARRIKKKNAPQLNRVVWSTPTFSPPSTHEIKNNV